MRFYTLFVLKIFSRKYFSIFKGLFAFKMLNVVKLVKDIYIYIYIFFFFEKGKIFQLIVKSFLKICKTFHP